MLGQSGCIRGDRMRTKRVEVRRHDSKMGAKSSTSAVAEGAVCEREPRKTVK